MKAAIITVAGISSRFNEGLAEDQKTLKAIYSEGDTKDTLLAHLVQKCAYADRIVVVGGYQFEELAKYYKKELSGSYPNVVLVKNDHYADLASGYSLFLGIQAAMEYQPEEVLFAEGDLDMDQESFQKIVDSPHSILTYNREPIYANKAVVLYENGEGRHRYAFNSAHGLLAIEEPFSYILNSGQVWKFTDCRALEEANEEFVKEEPGVTNLGIIQRYIDRLEAKIETKIKTGIETKIETESKTGTEAKTRTGTEIKIETKAGTGEIGLVGFKRWTNCNTRGDYRRILEYWRKEKES